MSLFYLQQNTTSDVKNKKDRIYKIKLNGDNLDGQILFGR